MNDPGSLQNLNDIVLPGAVAWWPPAPGWYAVLAIVLAVLLRVLFRALKAWQKNTYRRQALRELLAIRKQGSEAAGELSVLLKRAALSAWPRDDVASLSGAGWHAFLDRTAPDGEFATRMGAMLDQFAYSTRGAYQPTGPEFEQLCRAVEHWLKNHRAGGV